MSKIKQIQIGEDTFDLSVNASDIEGQVGGTLPQGGTQGQVLVKNSSTDYDTKWGDAGGKPMCYFLMLPDSGNINLGITTSTTDYVNGVNDKNNIRNLLNQMINDDCKNAIIKVNFGSGIIHSKQLVFIKNENFDITDGTHIISLYTAVELYMNRHGSNDKYLCPQLRFSYTIENGTIPVDGIGLNVLYHQAYELAEKSYVDGKAIPTGGSTGQVLAKASNTDNDVEWITPSGGGDTIATFTFNTIDLTSAHTLSQSEREELASFLNSIYDPLTDKVKKDVLLFAINPGPTQTTYSVLNITNFNFNGVTSSSQYLNLEFYIMNYSSNNNIRYYAINVNLGKMRIESGTIYIDKASLSLLNDFSYLSLNYNKVYTPTGNYNPATKKYVDDSIANAIGNAIGGSY